MSLLESLEVPSCLMQGEKLAPDSLLGCSEPLHSLFEILFNAMLLPKYSIPDSFQKFIKSITGLTRNETKTVYSKKLSPPKIIATAAEHDQNLKTATSKHPKG